MRTLVSCSTVSAVPAGIIGAANNGQGVTGMVPGMPIIALKVLNKDGAGTLSTIYTALAHVLNTAQVRQSHRGSQHELDDE
jgi:subtilisin family serine protease